MSNYYKDSTPGEIRLPTAVDSSDNQFLSKTSGKPVDARLEKISYALDQLFRIPGTDIRFGLDPILGFLLPVAGDSISALMSIYIVLRSIQYGLPKIVIGKMVFNIAMDSVVGSVPFVGDLLDFGVKANKKNVELLNRFAEGKEGSRWTDYLWLFLLLGLLGAFIIGWLMLIFWAVNRVFVSQYSADIG
jgi:hypothetical protein